MKRILFLLIALVCMPVALADFHYANQLMITTTFSTAVTFPEQVPSLTANVSFFPKTTQFQKLQSINSTSGRLEQHPTSLFLSWENIEGTLPYTITSTVLTKKKQPEIKLTTFTEDPKLALFTQPSELINPDHPEIQQLAKQLEQDTTFETAFAIATWVRANIDYDLSTLTADATLPAIWVMRNKKGVCDELSLLFISLMRSLNIPARYVVGIAHTDSELFPQGWVPHAWTEVFIEDKWIPFDLTFGQFGWLDATHITVKILPTADHEAVNYVWTYPVAPQFDELQVTAKVKHQSKEIRSPFTFSVHPLLDRVYPGSYVPVGIKIKNGLDTVMATTLEAVQTPGHIKDTTFPIFLLPNQEKEVYTIIQIPDDTSLDNYYQGDIILQDSFGNTEKAPLEFGRFYAKITEKNAEIINEITNRQTQANNLPHIYFDCIQNKRAYNTDEKAEIACTLKNNYNARQSIDLCFDECISVDLKPQEQIMQTISHVVQKETELEITATSGNKSAKQFVPILIMQNPIVNIENLNCPILQQGQTGDVTFTLTSDDYIEDIFIGIKGKQPIQLKDFEGRQDVQISITSTELQQHKDFLLVYVTYEDEDGVRYDNAEICTLELPRLSWYSRLINFFKSLWS